MPIHKKELSQDEKISLNHLQIYLGHYDKFLVLPDDLNVTLSGFHARRFSRRYFRNLDTYNKLLMSEKFYKVFENYQYILIYQLDCLVFTDKLLDWCARDFDFVGAPWIKGPNTEWITKEYVGNGGFSLRKVSTFLQVLNRYQNPFRVLGRNALRLVKVFCYLRFLLSRPMHFGSEVRQYAINIYRPYPQEDKFWAVEAKKWVSEYKVPSVQDAIAFAFETNPRECFIRNNQSLPFGCHGWYKIDRSFWEPFLIKPTFSDQKHTPNNSF